MANTKNNIVDFQSYKSKQAIKKQIKEMDKLHEEFILHEKDPVVRKGYINFMNLLKILDEKYENQED